MFPAMPLEGATQPGHSMQDVISEKMPHVCDKLERLLTRGESPAKAQSECYEVLLGTGFRDGDYQVYASGIVLPREPLAEGLYCLKNSSIGVRSFNGYSALDMTNADFVKVFQRVGSLFSLLLAMLEHPCMLAKDNPDFLAYEQIPMRERFLSIERAELPIQKLQPGIATCRSTEQTLQLNQTELLMIDHRLAALCAKHDAENGLKSGQKIVH
jgi:hypothetical protein